MNYIAKRPDTGSTTQRTHEKSGNCSENNSAVRSQPKRQHIRCRTPITASPVPWLTSIHATEGRGPYGDSGYRGSCSGLLIRDLLQYYRPASVLDPMSGGGTCRDVCIELEIPCVSFDLRNGFDATDAAYFGGIGPCDFVWLHPPYWNMVRYNDNPQCLSMRPTLDAFIDCLRLSFSGNAAVLSGGGHLGVLMGDGKHKGSIWACRFIALRPLGRKVSGLRLRK